MSTVIRPVLSPRNKYRINKHRYYELKHYCMQYPDWKNLYARISENPCHVSSVLREYVPGSKYFSDPTARAAIALENLSRKIEMIERAAVEADKELCTYILIGVTQGLSFVNLKMMHQIPCEKDMYYDRYRKFFWLLNNARN